MDIDIDMHIDIDIDIDIDMGGLDCFRSGPVRFDYGYQKKRKRKRDGDGDEDEDEDETRLPWVLFVVSALGVDGSFFFWAYPSCQYNPGRTKRASENSTKNHPPFFFLFRKDHESSEQACIHSYI